MTGHSLSHALPIDVGRTDPNQLGELLRSITFVGDGFGCYETFDVRDDAREWSEEERSEFINSNLDEDDDSYILPISKGFTFQEGNLLIDVFWFWDGDGTLVFRVRTPKEVLRVISNDDCKKNYVWQEGYGFISEL